MPRPAEWYWRLPLMRSLGRQLLKKYELYRMRSSTPERVFTEIYRRNRWRGRDSVSGTGSDLEQTAHLLRQLPTLLRDFRIQTLLDIPCGDFHWMRRLQLGDIVYTGADIVGEMIDENNARYASEGVSFRVLNLLEDPLPRVDLVFCRDCLVHFSHADVRRALRTLIESRSAYLLTTTFPSRRENRDIVTGEWRPLNLEAAPFHLPPPLRLIEEHCTEKDGAYQDKALGLWRLEDVSGVM